MRTHSALLACLLLLPAGPTFANEAPAEAAEALEAGPTAAPEEPLLQLVEGPADGALGDVATLHVPETYRFVPRDQMSEFNALTGNLDSDRDVGALISPEGWLVFFAFDPIGFVKDDDRDELDAEALLEQFKEAEKQSNEARREAGYPPLYLDGWQTEPYYDPQTRNLTWATRYHDDEDEALLNHQIRLLGRNGVMSVIVAADPDQMPAAVPEVGKLLEGYAFAEGERYADYRQGDRIAEYGLVGLVAGGGALLAAKSGLLAKLGKFAKVIVIAVGGAVAALWKRVKAFFGRA